MSSSSKKKILIVHSNLMQLEYLKENIAKYSFNVITASNSAKGFELAKMEKPDLILASAQLTEIDGFNFCWMIRRDPELEAIPYLLITDDNNPEERINAYRSGVDAFLDSSVSIREIYTLIETMIKRTKQIKGSIHSLQGKISHFKVVEILQMVNISKKSGTVTFINQDQTGSIGFWDGKIVWAELDQLTGEDAVKKIACWDQGNFMFEKDLIHPDINVNTPTIQLILDCCQLLDEKNVQH